jgi:hypothetical protein
MYAKRAFDEAAAGLSSADLAALSEMVYLVIANADLDALPGALLQAAPRLTKLTFLDLTGNAFTRLPESLATFPALNTLDITANLLSQLNLDELSSAPNIAALVASSNQITTISLPNGKEGVAPASTLKLIRLQKNRLTQLGAALTWLSRLELLDVHDNLLTVLYSTELPLFSHLRQLNVRGNAIRYTDRRALRRSMDWDRVAEKTPSEAILDNTGVPEKVGPRFLSPNVFGVFMEDNPSVCTWDPYNYWGTLKVWINCACASGVGNVLACPKPGNITCGTLRGEGAAGSLAGDAHTIAPPQLCDGIADCPDEIDEQDCTGLRLILVGSTEANTLFDRTYNGGDNCTSCFHRLSVAITRGTITLVSERNDGSGRCDSCDTTRGFIISEERALAVSNQIVMRYV